MHKRGWLFGFALVLIACPACSSADEYPPMLGDCTDCKPALSGGGSSAPDSSVADSSADVDAFAPPDVFEELDIVDVTVNLDAALP
jgi:hypothetical protein